MNFLKKVKDMDLKPADAKALHYKKYLAEIFLAIGIIALVFIIPFSSKAYATEEFWALNIGDETVAVLNSQSDANAVIDQVKEHYTQEGATDVAVTVDPAMTTEQKFYHSDETPSTVTVDEAVSYILTGKEEVVTYTVKDGDTLWTIAIAQNISFDELKSLNGLSDDSLIKPGDTLKLNATVPLVNVTTTQTITSTKTIEFETTTEETDSLNQGTTEVKTPGVNGEKQVTETVTMVNGAVTASTEISSTVTKEPTTEVVLKGTKVVATTSSGSSSSRSYADSATYSGNGAGIASFACQFVGNPYVYGGSSLTNGADCSGFVMAVFNQFGISLPHNAGSMRSYGRGVSMSEAQPGDLLCFYGHVGIYIGGGQMVHALQQQPCSSQSRPDAWKHQHQV